MTLDELMAALQARFMGRWDDIEITQHEYCDGSSKAEARLDGKVVASWHGELKTIPPRDGVTPRGPKVYRDLIFAS